MKNQKLFILFAANLTLFYSQSLVAMNWDHIRSHHVEECYHIEFKDTNMISFILKGNLHALKLEIESQKQQCCEAFDMSKEYTAHVILDSKDQMIFGTLLHFAAIFNQIEIAKWLLENGVNVDAQDSSFKETALHLACKYKYFAMVQLLLKFNARVDVSNYVGKTALFYACAKGQYELVLLLLSKKSDINHKDHTGKTPIYFANPRLELGKKIKDLLSTLGAQCQGLEDTKDESEKHDTDQDENSDDDDSNEDDEESDE